MESSNIEDLHTLISKTYQNIFDIAPVLKELSSAARAYHKALQNLSGASSIFHQALAKISRMASSSKGPAQILGETITDIMETHKDIENRRQEITKLMMNDLIIPIESLVESDNVYVKAILKNYNHDNKTKVELVEKARTELLKVRKKSQRKKPTEKYEEKEKQCDEYHNNLKKQLENFRKESCQRSLSEEWKRYVFVVDRSSIFMKTFMDFYDHNAAMLREKLSSWFAQVKKKPQYQDQELNGSIAQEIDPFGPATSKVKIMAIFDHNATEESQLSFKQGDVLDPISEVVSGWQYGQNIKTSKSGWYPAAYTQEIVAVPTGASTSQTLPASGVHTRPPLDQSSGHKSLKRYSSAGPSVIGAIPVPDYGPHEQAPEQNQEPLTPPATPVKNEVPATMTTPTATGPIPARPPSDTLPPPPPPPTPPPEQDNNNDSALSNPFTGIALKKTVTNDRSAPQIP